MRTRNWQSNVPSLANPGPSTNLPKHLLSVSSSWWDTTSEEVHLRLKGDDFSRTLVSLGFCFPRHLPGDLNLHLHPHHDYLNTIRFRSLNWEKLCMRSVCWWGMSVAHLILLAFLIFLVWHQTGFCFFTMYSIRYKGCKKEDFYWFGLWHLCYLIELKILTYWNPTESLGPSTTLLPTLKIKLSIYNELVWLFHESLRCFPQWNEFVLCLKVYSFYFAESFTW